jgi:hypothetical protein
MFIVLLIAFDSFGGGVQDMSSQSSPKDVVEKFCKLDAAGSRLSSDTRKTTNIESLLAWGEEGGYDEMIVIKNFKVNKAVITDSVATVTVEYNVLGSTDIFKFSKETNRHSKIEFKLLKQNAHWKIKEPVIAPHVHWKTAINHMRLLQKDEPVRKEQLESVIKKITAAAKR